MIKEHDRVVLKVGVPAEGLEAAAVVTVEAGQVRPVSGHDISHARALVST